MSGKFWIDLRPIKFDVKRKFVARNISYRLYKNRNQKKIGLSKKCSSKPQQNLERPLDHTPIKNPNPPYASIPCSNLWM